jgi:hypothetical protein
VELLKNKKYEKKGKKVKMGETGGEIKFPPLFPPS